MKALVNSILLLGVAWMIGGCASQTTFTQADQEGAPPPADDATRVRNFDPTTATYANGDTIAGNTGFNSTPERFRSPWQYYFIDTGIFFGNLFVSPFSLAMNHDANRFEGLRFEPTYTANPALPMSQSSSSDSPQPTVSPIPVAPADDSSIEQTTVEESTGETVIEPADNETNPQSPAEDLPVEPAAPAEPEPSTP